MGWGPVSRKYSGVINRTGSGAVIAVGTWASAADRAVAEDSQLLLSWTPYACDKNFYPYS